MRAEPAEGDVLVRMAADVEAVRIVELGVVEVGRDEPDDHLVAGLMERAGEPVSPTAVRRKCITVPQRRISSIMVSMSAAPSARAAIWSGCSMRARIPWVIV